MARGVRYQPGGIKGLLALYDEHSEAVEYDLIALGLRWRDLPSDRLTWVDLRAIVHASPRTSAVRRAKDPERAEWDATTYVLANVADTLAAIKFVITKALGGKPKRPKPHPRPGVLPEGVQRIRSKPVSLEQLRKRLGRDKTH